MLFIVAFTCCGAIRYKVRFCYICDLSQHLHVVGAVRYKAWFFSCYLSQHLRVVGAVRYKAWFFSCYLSQHLRAVGAVIYKAWFFSCYLSQYLRVVGAVHYKAWFVHAIYRSIYVLLAQFVINRGSAMLFIVAFTCIKRSSL